MMPALVAYTEGREVSCGSSVLWLDTHTQARYGTYTREA